MVDKQTDQTEQTEPTPRAENCDVCGQTPSLAPVEGDSWRVRCHCRVMFGDEKVQLVNKWNRHLNVKDGE